MKTAFANVLRNEASEFADSGETATIAAPTAALIHTRDAADYTALSSNCDLEKVADLRKVVHGLSSESQMALLSAASKGTRIVTTGLPLDIAAQLGEVTVIRSWNKTAAAPPAPPRRRPTSRAKSSMQPRSRCSRATPSSPPRSARAKSPAARSNPPTGAGLHGLAPFPFFTQINPTARRAPGSRAPAVVR